MRFPPSEETPQVGGRTDNGRASRVGLEVPVQLRVDKASCVGITKNIGPGGVFVATVRLPAGVGLRFIDTPLRAAILTNELQRSLRPDAA